MDPGQSVAAVAEEEHMLGRWAEEEEEEEAREEHAAFAYASVASPRSSKRSERESSLNKEGRGPKKRRTGKPFEEGEEAEAAPVMVPSQPTSSAAASAALVPTKDRRRCRADPADNSPRGGTTGPGPDRRSPRVRRRRLGNDKQVRGADVAHGEEGGGRSRSSLDHHPRGGFGWNEEKEKRRQDELASSVLESLTSGGC